MNKFVFLLASGRKLRHHLDGAYSYPVFAPKQ